MALLLAGVTGLMPTQRLPVVSSQAAAVRAASPLMGGAAALAKKEAAVQDIREGMADATLLFCVRSEGIPVNEINALRMNMPEDVKIKVTKNNLIKIAAAGEGLERFAGIAGEEQEITRMSNIWFYVPEDKMKSTVEGWAKHCKDFSNDKRNSDIIGGAFDGAVLDGKGTPRPDPNPRADPSPNPSRSSDPSPSPDPLERLLLDPKGTPPNPSPSPNPNPSADPDLTLTAGIDAISKLPTKQELMQSTAVAIKQVTPHLFRGRVRAGLAHAGHCGGPQAGKGQGQG